MEAEARRPEKAAFFTNWKNAAPQIYCELIHVAVHRDRHLILHAQAGDVHAVVMAALTDGQRCVVDLDNLAVVVAAADDVLVVEREVGVAEVAERVDIRVVQDGLERRRVHAAVHRREHAFVEGRERKLNGLETLVGNDVDAACRSGDVEFNAANDRYLANLARDKVPK